MLSDEAENSARGTHHGRRIRRIAETVEWAGAIAGPTLLITPLHKLASREVRPETLRSSGATIHPPYEDSGRFPKRKLLTSVSPDTSFAAYFAEAAFSCSTLARVSSGFFRASLSQPSQQRKTGFPSTMTLYGLPIEPSRPVAATAQNF